MARFLTTVLVACVVLGCSACTRTKAAKGAFGNGAIQLQVKADPQLNRFEKSAHALLLCLYQLKGPEGFNQLALEKDGIPRLLDCSRFDATVVSARQIVVQPGQDLKEIRDRGDGARYLGIAAGYYGLGSKRVTELSLLSTDKSGAPSETLVRIDLGPHEIRSVRVQ